jgi:sugar lactone lactonase YvrE
VAGEEGKLLPTVDPMKDIDKPMAAPEGEGFLLKQPGDACEDLCDAAVLVLDTYAERVQRFEAAASAPARALIPVRASAGQGKTQQQETVKNPRALLSSADGSLVLCDTWSHRVLRFPPAERAGDATLRELAAPQLLAGAPNSCGSRPDQLAFPSGVAFAREGALLVADTNNHRVQRFLPGELKATTVAGSPCGQSGTGLGELNMPTGICVDPRDDSVVVADRMNSRVLRFQAGSRAGDLGEVIVGPDTVQRPWGVCIDSHGSLYVSDERCGAVLKFELCAAGGAAAVGAPVAFAAAASTAAEVNPMALD